MTIPSLNMKITLESSPPKPLLLASELSFAVCDSGDSMCIDANFIAADKETRRGDDTVGHPHRAQISRFEIFEFVHLSKLDKQLPVERFEAAVSQSTVVALIAQWLERELRRRRSWVQSSPHQTERVRGQSTQSLWRITCPPPEQTPSTCRKDPLGQKKEYLSQQYQHPLLGDHGAVPGDPLRRHHGHGLRP